MAAVAAMVVAALQQRNGSGCGDGSLAAAAWRGAAAAARCWLRQRGSSGSGGGSSSVTVQRWWRGIGSLFDFGISLLVASLGGFGCGLECRWYFGSPFLSPWLTE
jgi:hypothetical protein